jgi:sodium pump decarboxylase gamma subunit
MQDGVTLLIVGMGTVFAFLVLLVVVMQTSARFLNRFFPEPPEHNPEATAAIPLPEIAVAVAAARAYFQT